MDTSDIGKSELKKKKMLEIVIKFPTSYLFFEEMSDKFLKISLNVLYFTEFIPLNKL